MSDRAASLALTLLLPLAACTPWAEADELEVPEQLDPLYDDPSAPLEVLDAEPEPADESEPSTSAEPPSEVCEQAIAEAREDFAKRQVHLDAYGYPSSCAFKYWRLLEEWYGIHTFHHGCVVPDLPDDHWERKGCYRREVDRLVFAKFGDDAYDKASRRAGCR